MRNLLITITSTLTFLTPSALAEETKAPETIVHTSDLGHGIYELRTDKAGNVGVSIGEDGVFMIDTQLGELTPLIDAAQRKLSGKDVELILNTHVHYDHIGGNAYFADKGALIMAHPNVRPGAATPVTSKMTGGTPEALPASALPTINVNAGDSVTMNGETAKFYHAPNAHTSGDIFVYFEEANILHAGDLLFANRFPYIDLDNGGSVDGYIEGMQAILDVANEDTVIIAGHGPTSTVKEVKASIRMLADTKKLIAGYVSQDKDLATIQAANPLSDYHDDWNWGFITTERMVWTLYRDLTGKIE